MDNKKPTIINISVDLCESKTSDKPTQCKEIPLCINMNGIDGLYKLILQIKEDVEKLKDFSLNIQKFDGISNGTYKVVEIKIKNPDELPKLLTQLKEDIGKLNNIHFN